MAIPNPRAYPSSRPKWDLLQSYDPSYVYLLSPRDEPVRVKLHKVGSKFGSSSMARVNTSTFTSTKQEQNASRKATVGEGGRIGARVGSHCNSSDNLLLLDQQFK
ncbi:unnamed protein product [Sphenostylis stenocarpa]|uniref:Uncharacterized protein n=1 Tax=Sphenostylis stenocarpa TaxID=92480 RepID=A0AA86SZ46_9FABA|nr:unnamed protein product [Sphenostylis stenocarpa]